MKKQPECQSSYWEYDVFLKEIDVAIIGSGLVGLNAAIYLAENYPKLKIVVLERGYLPVGASTRNAGFACFGSMTELLDDLSTQKEDEVWKLVEQRYRGLQKLRKRLGDKTLDYIPYGGFELFSKDEEDSYQECMDHMSAFNRTLSSITGAKVTFSSAEHKIKDFGLSNIKYLIHNKEEGGLHPGKMMAALQKKSRTLGITILSGVEVTHFEEDHQQVVLRFYNGQAITANRLLVATNGFAKQLLPKLGVTPARNQVFITKPIPGLQLQGTFHFDKGYIYFRNVDNRILIGGARNIDPVTEATVSFGATSVIQNYLVRFVDQYILSDTPNWEVDQSWSGIMGIGSTKKPIVSHIGRRVVAAVRLGGMGVALGSLLGEEGANLLMEC
ncbi:MAG: FAD-binding oxidoreductase [Saprospiraceae bacterium]|nr:FAD-binding oxidoreductase [Saprospiraceae bacterium]